MIWDKKDLHCRIIEVTVPFDINLEKTSIDRHLTYVDLMSMKYKIIQRMFIERISNLYVHNGSNTKDN